jgi:hypothetical protein
MKYHQTKMTVLAHPRHIIRFLNLQAANGFVASLSMVVNALFVLNVFGPGQPVLAGVTAFVVGSCAVVPLLIVNYRSVQAAIYGATCNSDFTPGDRPPWDRE